MAARQAAIASAKNSLLSNCLFYVWLEFEIVPFNSLFCSTSSVHCYTTIPAVSFPNNKFIYEKLEPPNVDLNLHSKYKFYQFSIKVSNGLAP